MIVAGEGIRVHARVRSKVGKAHGFAKALKATPQNGEHAFALKFFDQAIEQDCFGFALVHLGEAVPEFGLGLLHEGDDVFGEEGTIAIVIIWVAFGIASLSQ